MVLDLLPILVQGFSYFVTAWEVLEQTGDALDAVERGISDTCELNCCGDASGACGSIDESGDVSLDALIMHGFENTTCLAMVGTLGPRL